MARNLIIITTLAIATFGQALAGTNEQAREAKSAYLAAINSNDLDTFLAAVTEDIVMLPPNAPPMTGKTEVGPWVQGYFDAVRTSWQKETIEFVVSDGWAFELYSYTALDTPISGGASYSESGNGINIYKQRDDGIWLVARDVWAPSSSMSHQISIATCAEAAAGPC